MMESRSENLTALRIMLKELIPVNFNNISDDDLRDLLRHRRNSSSMDFTWTDDLFLSTHSSACGGTGIQKLVTNYAENYHVYCSVFVCIFGTVANIANVVVLTRKDMAAVPINRILTALAVADMLLMIEYIPFAYYYHLELLGKRDFPYYGAVFMLLHNHVTQILHTISICLTQSLAIWRYLAIGYPDKNHILCSDRRCTYAICTCYVLPLFLCIPSYLIFEISSTTIQEDGNTFVLYHTSLNEYIRKDTALLKVNFWLFAVLIKLLPCIILTIISCWLVKTLFRAKRRKQVLRGYDSYPLSSTDKPAKKKSSKSDRRADRTTKMLIAVLLLFLLSEFPQGLFALFIGVKGEDLFLDCYQKYGEVMDMMALLNGSINFILYCFMNKMFRTTFGQLFKQRLLKKLAGNPSDNQTTYV